MNVKQRTVPRRGQHQIFLNYLCQGRISRRCRKKMSHLEQYAPASSGRIASRESLCQRERPPPPDEEVEAIGGTYTSVVLLRGCRKGVLELAHRIPLAGHLGKKKTTERFSPRFYWPSMHQDVADYCKRCTTCKKFRRHRIPAPQWSHFQ